MRVPEKTNARILLPCRERQSIQSAFDIVPVPVACKYGHVFDGAIDVSAELSEIFKEEEINPDKTYHLVTFTIAAPDKLVCWYGQVFKLREGGREVGTFTVSDADPMEVVLM